MNSAYFGTGKPNFFSQLRNRTFSKDDPPSESKNKDPSSPARGEDHHLTTPPSSKPASTSTGLGNLTPGNSQTTTPIATTTSKEASAGKKGGPGNLTPFPLKSSSVEETVHKTPAETTERPVPKPRRLKQESQAPKPHPRSFHERTERSSSPSDITTTTQPIPAPRKRISVDSQLHVGRQRNGSDPPEARQRVYSKGTKEYKTQKKEEAKEVKVTTATVVPLGSSPQGPVIFSPFPLQPVPDDDPRSLINILDLDIMASMRSNYLKPEDMEDEADSDEETNQQIAMLKQENVKKSPSKDEESPLALSNIHQQLRSTIQDAPRKSPPPAKPPRAKPRSPGFMKKKQPEIESIDPEAALNQSQKFTKSTPAGVLFANEEKHKSSKGGFWKSPMFRRKSKEKKDSVDGDIPTRDFDSESIMSETSAMSPQEYPLHRTKQIEKLRDILARNPTIDVNKRDINYNTPLHFILTKKREKRCGLIMALLQTGRVDIDAQNMEDNTPLHIAVQINDYRCAAILLAFNASPFVKNCREVYPIELSEPGSQIYDLLSKQYQPLDNEPVMLSSLPEATAAIDPQELVNERIGRLLQPDKINWLVRKIDENIKSSEDNPFLDSFEAQPSSLRELTQAEKDARECLQDQKFYLRNWKSTNGSRVLFLDGGGVRGLIQIEILMELEKRTGRRVTELFDWIIGTSTGGIVALGLVYGGKTLEEMRNLYFTIKNEVFGGAGIAGTFMNMPQKSKKFDKVLQKVLEDKKMSDVKHPRVMICTVNKTEVPLKVEFFNNFMEDGNEHLRDYPVWKAARASSAAPMYFTEFEGYVDGGVLANNPCEFAMMQINTHDEKQGLPPRHFAMMVSIGTGIFPNRNLGDGKEFGMFNLKKQVKYVKEMTEMFMAAMADSEMTAEKFGMTCKQSKDRTPFFRFNPKLNSAIPPGEVDDEKLIDMLLDTKQYISERETQEKFTELVKIFKRLQSEK